jgi:hypothetical protein
MSKRLSLMELQPVRQMEAAIPMAPSPLRPVLEGSSGRSKLSSLAELQRKRSIRKQRAALRQQQV